MISEIDIKNALSLKLPIIDVRTPAEFEHGHIPGAVNIPLFSNEERAHVGTVYKQQSQEAAFKLGYEYVTPKLDDYITQAQKAAPGGKVIVHCWRGGMRSQAFGKHLADNGFTDVHVIDGGYKSYRKLVLESFEHPVKIIILGGYTGSGKTYILNELEKRGHQFIDFEGLAHHKGSAFGGIGQAEQPTVEQFENNIFEQWRHFDLNEPIWVEDENLDIGRVKIPVPLFNQMRQAQLIFIDIPKHERAKHLVEEYAQFDNQELADSIHRIAKRLGGLNEKNSIKFLEENNYYDVVVTVLQYYDKSYFNAVQRRPKENVHEISLPTINHLQNAIEIEKLGLTIKRQAL